MTTAPPLFDPEFRERLENLIRWRRDVRSFASTPVPPEMLDHLLDLADLAPSVGLSQPWRFVTVADPARRDAVRNEFERSNAAALSAQSATRQQDYARLKLAGLTEAPVHLAVFVDPDPIQGHGLGRATMPETAAYSAVMAIHTLWLAARAVGLGLGWVSILDPVAVRDILKVPQDWQLVGYLCLGHPTLETQTPELEREGWEQRRRTERLTR